MVENVSYFKQDYLMMPPASNDRMIEDCGAVGRMRIGRGNRSTWIQFILEVTPP
jgi:hypothetical protein